MHSQVKNVPSGKPTLLVPPPRHDRCHCEGEQEHHSPEESTVASESRTEMLCSTVRSVTSFTARVRNFTICGPFIPVLLVSATRVVIRAWCGPWYWHTFPFVILHVVEFAVKRRHAMVSGVNPRDLPLKIVCSTGTIVDDLVHCFGFLANNTVGVAFAPLVKCL